METRPGQSITTTRTMGANHMSAGRRPPGIISTKPTPKRVVMRLAKTTISTTATSKARLILENEYYDEVPSSRRRVGVMAIAGVFALALIGTAGAFGYRALFGSSGSPQPPPVIKADTGPSKIVPAASGKDTQSNKLITERVNERGQSEKLVSREEQPIDKPTTVVLSQIAPQQSSLGSGVVGSEPKKVRTIAIRPDQSGDVAPAAAPLATTAAARAPQASSAPAKPSAMPARPPENLTADADSDSTPTPVTRSASPARAPSSGNSPLSLSPDGPPRDPKQGPRRRPRLLL